MGLIRTTDGPHCPECPRGEYFIDMDWKHLCCCWHVREAHFLNPKDGIPGPHLKPGEVRYHYVPKEE